MFDFDSLVGLEESQAKNILKENGFKNIKSILNSKQTLLSGTKLVCAVQQKDDEIVLICGEFLLNIKEN